MKAFNGSAALKKQLIESVAPAWLADRTFASAMLTWSPEREFHSLNASLIQGDDPVEYEARVGIPVRLALLCEGMIAMDVVLIPNPAKPVGFDVEKGARGKAFGLEWLDAIPPGVDLAPVQPRFMLEFLEKVASPTFALAEHLSPETREVVSRIAASWRGELFGQPTLDAEWKRTRISAMRATERCEDAWGYPLSQAIESLAWPVASIASEFNQFFMMIVGQSLKYLQHPFLEPDDRANEIAMLEATAAISMAESETTMDQAAATAVFESRADWKRALDAVQDETVRARVREARLRALPRTDAEMGHYMDAVLRIISSASDSTS